MKIIILLIILLITGCANHKILFYYELAETPAKNTFILKSEDQQDENIASIN